MKDESSISVYRVKSSLKIQSIESESDSRFLFSRFCFSLVKVVVSTASMSCYILRE